MSDPRLEHPSHCLVCGEPFDFTTDGVGHVIVLHSVKPCKPKPQGQLVECSVCGDEFRVFTDIGRRTLFWCSEECEEVLRDIRRKKCLEYSRKMARLNKIYRRNAA